MIIAVIQARMGSTRLPGKTLLPILGRPMLAHQIDRVQRAKLVDQVILATSGHPSDEPIQQFAQQNAIPCIRGSVDDVLDRFYQAAKRTQAEHVVRLTGDCPLSDPDIIDAVVSAHVKQHNDYTSNVHPPTYPDGFDVEVITARALQAAWNNANKASEREHVTSYFRRTLPHVQRGNVAQETDLSHMRLTVDEAADYEVIKAVFEAFVAQGNAFSLADVVGFLADKPDLAGKNAGIERNAGFQASLEKDAIAGAA
ncbi:MAG: glycosyltransferase family protein [Pseudomonadota bacterium]